jgi:sugar lactone lactonase YvrE
MIKEVLFISVVLVAFSSSHAQAVVLEIGDVIVGDLVDGDSVIYHVDPTTGNRTVISSSSVGSGTNLGEVNSIALEKGGSILVVDRGSGAIPNGIIRIDPVTGNRTTLSSASMGTGQAFSSPVGIAVDSSGNIFVSDLRANTTSAVVQIDPTSGSRTVFSGGATGGGDTFERPGAIAFDASGNMYVTDDRAAAGGDRIVRVDATNGDRTNISSGTPSVGSGSSFTSLEGGLAALGGTLYTSDLGVNSIVSVAIADGDRSTLAFGAPNPFSLPYQIALNADNNLVVANANLDQVLLVNTGTGARTILSAGPGDGSVGSGPGFTRPFGIAVVQTLVTGGGAPEPASILLLVTGVFWIAARRPRRGRRS